MQNFDWQTYNKSFDDRRNLIIPGTTEKFVLFCAHQFLQVAQEAIKNRGIFIVALSGGSTPNAIFKELSKPYTTQLLDWSKVLCFWSDERSVPPTHKESNYLSAMEAGIAALPLLPYQIFRMPAELDIQQNALVYEHLIRSKVPDLQFDLIMLGMGEDGHTASLFPHTQGLHIKDRLIIANYVPQKSTWRMSMTYECIHKARLICIYVTGANKAGMIQKVLLGAYDPDNFPAQRVGTTNKKATWILDTAASSQLGI